MIRDPIREGLAAGWKVTDAAALDRDLALEADVAIVGTGAGGGVTAEILAAAGLEVLLIEEGALRTSTDFRMLEAEAYPQLYQESAARKTLDKAITILQGRCVGGSTTVNWTSSFRTPDATLAYWRDRFGLSDLAPAALAPWYERMEARLAIGEWTVPPNENNALLARGAAKLGIATGAIRRNVSGCWNIGYCGMGCPTNAKQSMLVTTIPAALARGARLVYGARAERFALARGRAAQLECSALDPRGVRPAGPRIRVRARHYVLAAGAIGTPALLLRSGAPDPHRTLGRRTFLHPTVVSAAVMPERVDGYAGAPQTIYSDHFLDRDPDRRADRLQARGAAAASGPLRYDAPGIRGRARGRDGEVRPHPRADRAAPGRLSPGEHRRERRAARRRLAGARVPADAVRLGRGAAGARRDGGDPVCRGRDAGSAGARARAALAARSPRRAPWSPACRSSRS